MRSPRLFDRIDWKSKKKGFHVRRILFFPLKIGEGQQKKAFVVRDKAPHFLQGLRL